MRKSAFILTTLSVNSAAFFVSLCVGLWVGVLANLLCMTCMACLYDAVRREEEEDR